MFQLLYTLKGQLHNDLNQADLASVRLPSFSGHPISADLVSVREDVHCESTTPEIHT